MSCLSSQDGRGARAGARRGRNQNWEQRRDELDVPFHCLWESTDLPPHAFLVPYIHHDDVRGMSDVEHDSLPVATIKGANVIHIAAGR
jgi:hypothetical protein